MIKSLIRVVVLLKSFYSHQMAEETWLASHVTLNTWEQYEYHIIKLSRSINWKYHKVALNRIHADSLD